MKILYNLMFILIYFNLNAQCFLIRELPPSIIIDSNISFEEAIEGKTIPENIVKNLTIIDVKYIGYDSLLRRGQIVIHNELANDIAIIFDSLLTLNFQIEKVIPICSYSWDDDSSMTDNNTSAFNYRTIANTNKLSLHATGRAIDINPRDNPFIKGKIIQPLNGNYDLNNKGTIVKGSSIVKLFKKMGWKWGGDWRSLKDYQHFEKR